MLGIEVKRISRALRELEMRSLIVPYVETFGHTLTEGACRITRSGWAVAPETAERVTVVEKAVDSVTGDRPEVFISYSHDSKSHKSAVRDLSDQLRRMGVDSEIDQYVENPDRGWVAWMEQKTQEADFVIVVCTPTYLRRVTGNEEGGVGLGSTREGMLIDREIFEAGGKNTKYLPIVFDTEHQQSIPKFLADYTFYDLSLEDGFESLFRRITSQPLIKAPALGDLVQLGVEEEAPSQFTPADFQAESMPSWHMDIVAVWGAEGGNTRHTIRWEPGIGFSRPLDLDTATDEKGGTPAPPGFPDKAITVSYLANQQVRLDFADPLSPVFAVIHDSERVYQPQNWGGGARNYLVFDLARLGLGDASE